MKTRRAQSDAGRVDPNTRLKSKRRFPVISSALLAACIGVFVLSKTRHFKGLNGRLALNGPLLKKEPWRLISHTIAHQDAMHLLCNMLSLAALGIPLELEIGSKKFGMIALASGAASTAAILGFNFNRTTLGASGIIFGLFGAAVSQEGPERRMELTLALAPEVISSFLPGVSWPAHIGGLLAGLPFGWALLRPERAPKADEPTAPLTAPWVDIS